MANTKLFKAHTHTHLKNLSFITIFLGPGTWPSPAFAGYRWISGTVYKLGVVVYTLDLGTQEVGTRGSEVQSQSELGASLDYMRQCLEINNYSTNT